MIKVKSVSNLNHEAKEAEVTLISDTKSEVTSEATIVGMPSGYKPSFGSSIMTCDGNYGMLQSNGNWSWL